MTPRKSALRHRYRHRGHLKNTKLKLKVAVFKFPAHLARSEGHISGFSPSPPCLAPPVTAIPVVRRRAMERPKSTRASPDRHRRPLRVSSGEGERQRLFFMCFNKRRLKSSSLSFRFIGRVWVVVINEDTQSAFYHPERRSRLEVWAECQHSAKSNTVQRTTGFKLIPQIPELSAAPAAVCLQLGSNDRLAFAIQPVYKKKNNSSKN